ncbi:hypothetical protein BDK51DRAFT_31058 [Blyttiomyces helicus]|uniref:Uncharacterized protein n=1 Tax=Blyttiomyces helicus TaxID=388810 RepID=A0A4P9WEG1_9FUNG|nr:hypothetical protein BDK51DRAFT_31058 [Blyttiomyces helicus]|eukprot:RKO90782.1 hypothetical protein BDK51DRAFT_31058 [Blyttiomyces helicus]
MSRSCFGEGLEVVAGRGRLDLKGSVEAALLKSEDGIVFDMEREKEQGGAATGGDGGIEPEVRKTRTSRLFSPPPAYADPLARQHRLSGEDRSDGDVGGTHSPTPRRSGWTLSLATTSATKPPPPPTLLDIRDFETVAELVAQPPAETPLAVDHPISMINDVAVRKSVESAPLIIADAGRRAAGADVQTPLRNAGVRPMDVETVADPSASLVTAEAIDDPIPMSIDVAIRTSVESALRPSADAGRRAADADVQMPPLDAGVRPLNVEFVAERSASLETAELPLAADHPIPMSIDVPVETSVESAPRPTAEQAAEVGVQMPPADAVVCSMDIDIDMDVREAEPAETSRSQPELPRDSTPSVEEPASCLGVGGGETAVGLDIGIEDKVMNKEQGGSVAPVEDASDDDRMEREVGAAPETHPLTSEHSGSDGMSAPSLEPAVSPDVGADAPSSSNTFPPTILPTTSLPWLVPDVAEPWIATIHRIKDLITRAADADTMEDAGGKYVRPSLAHRVRFAGVPALHAARAAAPSATNPETQQSMLALLNDDEWDVGRALGIESGGAVGKGGEGWEAQRRINDTVMHETGGRSDAMSPSSELERGSIGDRASRATASPSRNELIRAPAASSEAGGDDDSESSMTGRDRLVKSMGEHVRVWRCRLVPPPHPYFDPFARLFRPPAYLLKVAAIVAAFEAGITKRKGICAEGSSLTGREPSCAEAESHDLAKECIAQSDDGNHVDRGDLRGPQSSPIPSIDGFLAMLERTGCVSDAEPSTDIAPAPCEAQAPPPDAFKLDDGIALVAVLTDSEASRASTATKRVDVERPEGWEELSTPVDLEDARGLRKTLASTTVEPMDVGRPSGSDELIAPVTLRPLDVEPPCLKPLELKDARSLHEIVAATVTKSLDVESSSRPDELQNHIEVLDVEPAFFTPVDHDVSRGMETVAFTGSEPSDFGSPSVPGELLARIEVLDVESELLERSDLEDARSLQETVAPEVTKPIVEYPSRLDDLPAPIAFRPIDVGSASGREESLAATGSEFVELESPPSPVKIPPGPEVAVALGGAEPKDVESPQGPQRLSETIAAHPMELEIPHAPEEFVEPAAAECTEVDYPPHEAAPLLEVTDVGKSRSRIAGEQLDGEVSAIASRGRAYQRSCSPKRSSWRVLLGYFPDDFTVKPRREVNPPYKALYSERPLLDTDIMEVAYPISVDAASPKTAPPANRVDASREGIATSVIPSKRPSLTVKSTWHAAKYQRSSTPELADAAELAESVLRTPSRAMPAMPYPSPTTPTMSLQEQRIRWPATPPSPSSDPSARESL